MKFSFRSVEGRPIPGKRWVGVWWKRYPNEKYESHHDALIAKLGLFAAADFERIGRWKDGARSDSKWRPNIASVAYPVWMQAVKEVPTCPEDAQVLSFLDDWAERKYTDTYSNGPQEKRFGLSRATTLLYFLSAKRFPIFDSRVRTAIRRLGAEPIAYEPEAYLEKYLPLMDQIAKACGTRDMRKVDQALFAYGSKKAPFEQ